MIGLINLEVYNSTFNITKKLTNPNFLNILIQRVVVFYMKSQRED